jgi:Flp pilus assembly pilin Flp
MHLPTLFAWVSAKLHIGERDSRGASMVEYILLVAFIALIVLIAVNFLGDETSKKFSSAGASVKG